MFFVRLASLYFSLANVIISLGPTHGALSFLSRRLLLGILLVHFEIPLLTTSDVVWVVNETVLELTGSRLSSFGYLLLALSSCGLSTGLSLLLLNAVEVSLLHGLELHLVLVALGGVLGGVTHLVEGVYVPLRVFQELVNVLSKHLFKIAVLHADLARLFGLLSADHGNLLLLRVLVLLRRVFSESGLSLVGSRLTACRPFMVETVVDGALTMGVESSDLVSEGSELADTRLSEFSRHGDCGVLRDVSWDDTLSVILNSRTGLRHMGVSTVHSSHLEVTVSRLQELVGVFDLLLGLLLFLLAYFSKLHFPFRREWVLMDSAFAGSSSSPGALFFLLDFFDLIVVALVETLVSDVVVSGGVSHHAIN